MGFKYCVIGDTCYEYNKFKNDKNSPENKLDEDKRKAVRDELDIIEIGPHYADKLVYNESKIARDDLNYTIQSISNPNIVLQINNDKELVNEYWKALSTAHECSVEEKEKQNSGTVDIRIEGQGIDILDSPMESDKIKVSKPKKKNRVGSEDSRGELLNKKITSIYTVTLF
jgi:hypothetical protein